MIKMLEKLILSHQKMCLQQDSSDKSVRVVNSVTSKCESTAGQ